MMIRQCGTGKVSVMMMKVVMTQTTATGSGCSTTLSHFKTLYTFNCLRKIDNNLVSYTTNTLLKKQTLRLTEIAATCILTGHLTQRQLALPSK